MYAYLASICFLKEDGLEGHQVHLSRSSAGRVNELENICVRTLFNLGDGLSSGRVRIFCFVRQLARQTLFLFFSPFECPARTLGAERVQYGVLDNGSVDDGR